MFKFKIISGLYKNLIFSKNTNFNIDRINVNMVNQIKYESGQNVTMANGFLVVFGNYS